MLVKHKRGTTQELSTYVGVGGGIAIDTDLNRLLLLDGSTPGGFPMGSEVSLQGPSELLVGVPNVFTIVNYNTFSDYEVHVDRGTVSLDGPTITVEVGVLGGTIDLVVKCDGKGRLLTLQVERNLGPGPRSLVAGDFTAGFFGEVGPTDPITYDGLASQIGLSAGTSQHNAESKWLKFALDESILFVMMKPGRYGLSWDHINSVNAVYGDLEVDIGNHRYKCRLIKGASSDPTPSGNGFNPVTSQGSEWNRLMYPIHSGVHTDDRNPDLPEYGTWASYSDTDLLVHNSHGDGSSSWCQETNASSSGQRLYRGYNGVSSFVFLTSSNANAYFGWRACLELITD